MILLFSGSSVTVVADGNTGQIRTDGLCYAAQPVNAAECPRKEYEAAASIFTDLILREGLLP